MRFHPPGQIARALPGVPNLWDLVVFPLVLAALFLVAWGSHQMTAPYQFGEVISLDPANLPHYASLAAKYRRAEMIMIPALDILQSVPILGFLSLRLSTLPLRA